VKTLDGRAAIFLKCFDDDQAVAKLIQAEQSTRFQRRCRWARPGHEPAGPVALTAIAAREIDPDDAYVYAWTRSPSRSM